MSKQSSDAYASVLKQMLTSVPPAALIGWLRGKAAKGKKANTASSAQKKYSKKRSKVKVEDRTIVKKISSMKDLEHRLAKIERQGNAQEGHMIYRIRSTSALTASTNVANFGIYSMLTVSQIEAALTHLKYYDPATPGTLVTAAFSSGTYSRKCLLSKAEIEVVIKNSYNVSCQLEAHWCIPKKDTNVSPYTAFVNGIADDPAGPGNTSVLIKNTDSGQLLDFYSLYPAFTGYLEAGKQKILKRRQFNIIYDPAPNDTITEEYQVSLKATILLIRLMGVVGHDSLVDEQTLLPAGIDVQTTAEYHVRYPAGVDIRYVIVSNSSDSSFTNAGVTGVNPINDNHSYSSV